MTVASQVDMQVYYAPRQPVYCQVTLPTVFGGFRLLRTILIRERISLVHAHQAFSVMGHEAILQARTMGYKVKQAMCPALASISTRTCIYGTAIIGIPSIDLSRRQLYCLLCPQFAC